MGCVRRCSSESTSQQVTPGQIESIDIQMAVNLTRLPAAQWMGVYPFIIINLSSTCRARRSWGWCTLCHVMFGAIYYVTTNTDSGRKHHSKSESSCLKAAAYDKMVP